MNNDGAQSDRKKNLPLESGQGQGAWCQTGHA